MPASSPLTADKLSRPLHASIAVGAVVVASLITVAFGAFRWGWALLLAVITYSAAIYVTSRVIEGRRQAADRLATALVSGSFAIVILPLISVIWTVVSRGATRFDGAFLSDTMALSFDDTIAMNDGAAVGGALHALVGTLIVTGIAAVLSVPLGLLTAIYLVEYGRGRLARFITAMVDVMTGIPSIVAGLFAFALFTAFFGAGTKNGFAGAVALTLLMTPVVVRTSEEMLRLVPDELREASYALGVPKWKTIVKVVMPTAIAGILTGITLSIARVIGETAPLLVTAGLARGMNTNPVDGFMTTLPVFTFNNYGSESTRDLAWAGALLLVIIVAVLFSIARVLAYVLKPKGLK
jgi:phosphate transport system permease protein